MECIERSLSPRKFFLEASGSELSHSEPGHSKPAAFRTLRSDGSVLTVGVETTTPAESARDPSFRNAKLDFRRAIVLCMFACWKIFSFRTLVVCTLTRNSRSDAFRLFRWALPAMNLAMGLGMATIGSAVAQTVPGQRNEGSASAAEASGEPIDDASVIAQVQSVVRELGSADFATRESAAVRLHSLGFDATVAIAAELDRTGDPEIAMRLRTVLGRLIQDNNDLRTRLFLRGHDVHLEGWSYFSRWMNDSPPSRDLFVEMSQANPVVTAALDGGNVQRAMLQRRLITERAAVMTPGGSIPGLDQLVLWLLLAADPNIRVSVEVDQAIVRLLQIHSGDPRLKDPRLMDPIRGLFSKWLYRCQPETREAALMMGLALEVPEVRSLAREILQREVAAIQKDAPEQAGKDAGDTLPPQSPLQQQMAERASISRTASALYAMAKYGGPAEVPLVMPLIDDPRSVSGGLRTRQLRRSATVGDFATAALTLMTGHTLADAGFSPEASDPVYGFRMIEIGFSDDEQDRREAIRKVVRQWAQPMMPQAEAVSPKAVSPMPGPVPQDEATRPLGSPPVE